MIIQNAIGKHMVIQFVIGKYMVIQIVIGKYTITQIAIGKYMIIRIATGNYTITKWNEGGDAQGGGQYVYVGGDTPTEEPAQHDRTSSGNRDCKQPHHTLKVTRYLHTLGRRNLHGGCWHGC